MNDTVTSAKKNGTSSVADQADVGKLLFPNGDTSHFDVQWDISYGSEEGMAEAEERRQPYLFNLRQTTKVQKQIRDLERDWEAWADAGDGWQGAECTLKLMGWSRARRCVFLRRAAQKGPSHKTLPASTHALADRIRLTLSRIGQFLNGLVRTAEQLSAEAIWAIILSAAFVKWLRGKVLQPVTHGGQVLLQLPV